MNKLLFTLGAAAIALAVCSCSNSKNDAKNDEASEKVETSTKAPEKSLSELNGEAGKAFMDTLKKDADVKFTESGLAYKVIKEGKGNKPTPDNTANVKYTGKHINGEIFDSSEDQVIPFPLRRVVPGFTEGICLMNPGAVYELYLPANLAYGQAGTPGGPIGPNETLIFEVELVDFE